MFKLEFTKEEVSIVEAGVKELPGKYCLPVLNAIARQLTETVKEEDPKIETKEKK